VLCSASLASLRLSTSSAQVYLLVVSALVMGFSFGLIFGLLDVEDESLGHLRVALLREQSICYPIGAALGGLAAMANQHLRDQVCVRDRKGE
jgi:hypothetical protein